MTSTLRTFDTGYSLRMEALRGNKRAQADLERKFSSHGTSAHGRELIRGAEKAEADYGRCSLL